MTTEFQGPFKPTRLYSMAVPKKFLRATLAQMTDEFLARGGKITVCRPGVAQGASFGRNKSPFNKLRGVDRPSIYS